MYDYRTALINDILDAIEDNKLEYTEEYIEENFDELCEELYDELWIDDSVTGNASGSYTFNSAQAEEYVKDNLSLCTEALMNFGDDGRTFFASISNEEWEYLDVTIRCYLLGECIAEALRELA